MLITTLVFEQMSLHFEGAMGGHCNRKTERQMTKSQMRPISKDITKHYQIAYNSLSYTLFAFIVIIPISSIVNPDLFQPSAISFKEVLIVDKVIEPANMVIVNVSYYP